MINKQSISKSITICLGALLIGTSYSCKNESESVDAAEEINDDRFEDNSKENDAEFIVDAATMDLKNIELAKLAMRSSNSDIKANTKMMEEGHTKLYNEIKMLAEQKQIAIPLSIGTDAINEYKDLNDKTGTDFDKKYLDVMVNNHEDVIKKYESYVEDSKDAEIKTWAVNTLAGLRTHLQHTKDLKEKYK